VAVPSAAVLGSCAKSNSCVLVWVVVGGGAGEAMCCGAVCADGGWTAAWCCALLGSCASSSSSVLVCTFVAALCCSAPRASCMRDGHLLLVHTSAYCAVS
jgi:hypothetical protein